MVMNVANWKLVVQVQHDMASHTGQNDNPDMQRVRRQQLDTQVNRQREQIRDRWLLMGGPQSR